MTQNYFNDKNTLDPLAATQNGQNQYNDKLQFEMTDSYRKSQAAFFEKYQNALQNIDIKNLKVVMDTGRLVGEIGDSVNGFLGQQTQNDLRYR